MILKLDLGSNRPLFRQIVDGVKESIVDGHIGPGEALPPGRELAASLDVSLETVQRAYRALAEEGVVTSRVGRGTRIVDDVDLAGLQMAPLISALIETARGAGISRIRLVDLVTEAYQ